MKKFFSYVFTFVAVFLISAAATISLSVAGDTYTNSNTSAEGQGSSLSFLTNMLETLNNGKTINLDAGISVSYEDDEYELLIDGMIDIKDSNNIKIDANIICTINDNVKNIYINLYDNIAHLKIDDIKLKVDIDNLVTILSGIISNDEDLGESAQTFDFGVLLDLIDLNGIMAALNNMQPITEGTDTIYPLKQDGVIDAEIVMNKDNELKQLSLNKFNIMGIELSVNADLTFDYNEVQKETNEDNQYLDVIKVYENLQNIKNIDNKHIDLNTSFKSNNNEYSAKVGFEFSRVNNYYSADLLIPNILDKTIKVDYLNNNLYLNVANIKVNLDNELIGFIFELINKNNLINFDKNNISVLPQINLNESGVDFNLETILSLLENIKVNGNEIKVSLDLNSFTTFDASGLLEITFVENEIKEINIAGEYNNQELNLQLVLSELESIAKIEDFDDYLNIKDSIINHINLFDIKSGNLGFNFNIQDLNGKNIFDFESQINANLNDNYYSFESDFVGDINGILNLYYCGDIAYLTFNDIKICCSKLQAEKIYNEYIKNIIGNQNVNTDEIMGNLQNKLIFNKTNLFENIDYKNIIGLFKYIDSVVINKDLIQIDINEITDDSDMVIDFLFENQEIKEFKLSNVNIGKYIVNADTLFNKYDFKKKDINEEEYLNVIKLLENTYCLKDLRYGTINAIIELWESNNYNKFDINLDFDVQDINDLYINSYINLQGMFDIDSNIVLLDDELYINLYNNYIKLDLSKYDLFSSIFNIDSKNLIDLSNILKEQIPVDDFKLNDINIFSIISLVKNIEINSNLISITIDGKILNSNTDLIINIGIENNSIKSIAVKNLLIDEKKLDIVLNLDKSLPIRKVNNFDKYLDVENIVNELNKVVSNFGFELPKLENFELSNDFKLDVTSDLLTSITKSIDLNEINNVLKFIKNCQIDNKNLIVKLDASLINRTGELFIVVDLVNNSLNNVNIKTNDGLDLSFTFNDEETDYINVYNLYNNILKFKDIKYGSLNVVGNYNNSYNFNSTINFNFEDLRNIFINLSANVWGGLQVDANVSLLENELYVKLYENNIKFSLKDILPIIKELKFDNFTIDTNNLISSNSINLETVLDSIKTLNVKNNKIELSIDLNFIGVNSLLDLTVKIKNNEITGFVVENLNINGNTLNLDIDFDKNKPQEVIENKESYLNINELLVDVNKIVDKLGFELSEIKSNVLDDKSNSINSDKLVEDILGIQLNVNDILTYLKSTKINNNIISLSVQGGLIYKDGLLDITVHLDNNKVDYLTIKNNENLNIEISFNKNYKDKIFIYDLYENILKLKDLRYGNLEIEAIYKYLSNEYLISADVNFDFENLNQIYLNLLGNISSSINTEFNLALMNNQIFINLFDVFAKAEVEDIKDLLNSVNIDTNKIYEDFKSELKNTDTSNFTINNILNSVKYLKLDSNCIIITFDTSLFGFNSVINLVINIENNEVVGFEINDFIFNGHNISLNVKLNKIKPTQEVVNSQKYVDIFNLIDNVLALQDLRHGTINATGYYSYLNKKYDFGLDFAFDFENLNSLYLNAGIDITGDLNLDADFALYNEQIYVRLFETYLKTDLEFIFNTLQSFGVDFNELKHQTKQISLDIDVKSLNLLDIISSIQSIIINNEKIEISLNGAVFGIDSIINATIKIQNNDVTGINIQNLNINGHIVSLDLTLDKDLPNKNVENSNKYLEIETLINSAENIISEFGLETSNILNNVSNTSSNIKNKKLIKNLLGIELNFEDIANYLNTITINNSEISFEILGKLLKRNSNISILVGLNDSKLEYLSINDNSGISIDLAFNNNHEDKINIYDLIENVLALQNLRFGSAKIDGVYNDGLSRYLFNINGDFDLSDLNNIYLNTGINISGGTNIDASVAILNNEIYARLFDTYLNINIDDIKNLINELDIEESSINLDTNVVENKFNNLSFTFDKLLLAIKNVKIQKDSIHVILDAGVFGMQTLINVTIKLENNDVSGLTIKNFIFDGKIINLNIDLNKNKPKQLVENQQHYLDAFKLVDDVKEIINNFTVLTNGLETQSNYKPQTIKSTDLQDFNINEIVQNLLGFELNATNIINYLNNVEINSSKIFLTIKGDILERESDIIINASLKESDLDSINITDSSTLDLGLAFNDNHEDKLNIYKLYDNIISLQYLRFGNVNILGNYSNNINNYEFNLNANFDFSNIENVYINALANITGDLKLDANIAIINNEIFARLFNNYLTISFEDIKTLISSFGVEISNTNLALESKVDLSQLNSISINNIISAIEKVSLNKDSINLIVNLNSFGIDSIINATIKIQNNEVVGLMINNFKYNESEISLDIDLDREKPEQIIENSKHYLNVIEVLKDVKNIVYNFGYELPEKINISNSSDVDVKQIANDVLGLEDLSIVNILGYLEQTKISSSLINFNLDAGVIERTGELNISVGLINNTIDYVRVANGNDLSLALAFNDLHEDMINAYTLYDNILALQYIRYGSADVEGIYKYDSNVYNFNIDGSFNFEDLENIFVNANINVYGSLDIDASVAVLNNAIFARLFDIFVTTTESDINEILSMFNVQMGEMSLDTNEIINKFNFENLSVSSIIKAVEKVIINKNSIMIVVDASIIGIDSKLDITIKLLDNDVVGVAVKNLNIDGHELTIDINLNKEKPIQEISNTDKYLNVLSLTNSIKDIVSEFDVEIPETLDINNNEIDAKTLVSDIFGIEIKANSILNYLKTIELNSSKIKLDILADLINRDGKLYIECGLVDSALDYITIKDDNNLDISLAVNDNHDDKINVYKLYDNILSLLEIKEAYLDASANIYDNNGNILSLNLDGSINISDNYLSAFVRYVCGDVDFSANVSHINKTFYLDYTDAKLKLSIESLLELINIQIDEKENSEVTLIDLINYIINNLNLTEDSLSIEIDTNKILDIIAGINIAKVSGDSIEIELSGHVINQDKDLKVIITLKDNDISGIEIYRLKINDINYIDIKANFNRESNRPEITDSEYFDAYIAYNSIIELFENEDVTLQANGTVYNYNDVNYNKEFDFNVDARKNVVDGKIGAYVLANILGANYGSRNHSFKLNYINDELFIDYNTLKGHLAKSAITNTVLSVIDLIGIDRKNIEPLLDSVEDLFEGVGLDQIFKNISGIDIEEVNISIDETIFNILGGLTLSTNGTTLSVIIDGEMIGIDGNIDLSLTTVNGKIRTIQFNKLGLGGKYVDTTINVSPEVVEMPTLTQSEKDTYWDFNSLEELSNMLYTTVNGIETFKLSGNVTLGLGSIQAADVPVNLYINRDSSDNITLYGKLEIPTGSAAFKEYKGVYHIEQRTSYIYYDGQYLYVHRIDKVRTSILAWNKNTKDHHFYGKIQFSYFNDDLFAALDFILGFSDLVSTFKNEFNKGGTTDTPPYIENIFLGYSYTANSSNNMFDVKISGDALIQNDKIGDIELRIGKNNQTGMIAGIYAKMKVVSIINVIANLSVERISDSVEFRNCVNSNIIPNSSNYKNDQLIWAF